MGFAGVVAASQDTYKGGGKDWVKEHHTFKYTANASVAELMTALTEVYNVQIQAALEGTVIGTVTEAVQVITNYSPGTTGTIGTVSSAGVITPAVSGSAGTAGGRLVAIGRTENLGTAGTQTTRYFVELTGRS